MAHRGAYVYSHVVKIVVVIVRFLQRWHTRRQQKKVKVIADLTEREQRSIRKKWQSSKAEYRKLQKTRENDTPPVSGLSNPTEKRRGRPRVPYRFQKHTRRLIN